MIEDYNILQKYALINIHKILGGNFITLIEKYNQYIDTNLKTNAHPTIQELTIINKQILQFYLDMFSQRNKLHNSKDSYKYITYQKLTNQLKDPFIEISGDIIDTIKQSYQSINAFIQFNDTKIVPQEAQDNRNYNPPEYYVYKQHEKFIIYKITLHNKTNKKIIYIILGIIVIILISISYLYFFRK
jgi:hypothetical protein